MAAPRAPQAPQPGPVADAPEGGGSVPPAGGPGRQRRPARVAAALVAVLLAALIGVLVWGVANRDADPDSGPSPLDGRVAPALTGPTLDGARFDLQSQRGNWVVVNFFATWCPPCVQEHPELRTFAERNASRNRRIIGVVFGGAGEAESVRKFMAANGGSWPVVVDNGRIAVDYAVPKVPESILVSPTGLVYTKLRGGVTADELDGLIDSIEAAAAQSGGAGPGTGGGGR